MEFARNPAEKISINRIVQTADISRGSFYQYFDDKVDLVEILTEGLSKFAYEITEKSLQKNNGDIFQTTIDVYDATIELSQNDTYSDFFKNIMSNIKINDDLFNDYMKNRCNEKQYDCLMPYVNTGNFRFKSEDEYKCITEILLVFLFNAFFELFAKGQNSIEVRESLLLKIKILKEGVIVSE